MFCVEDLPLIKLFNADNDQKSEPTNISAGCVFTHCMMSKIVIISVEQKSTMINQPFNSLYIFFFCNNEC